MEGKVNMFNSGLLDYDVELYLTGVLAKVAPLP
jgi:hypothetical protein